MGHPAVSRYVHGLCLWSRDGAGLCSGHSSCRRHRPPTQRPQERSHISCFLPGSSSQLWPEQSQGQQQHLQGAKLGPCEIHLTCTHVCMHVCMSWQAHAFPCRKGSGCLPDLLGSLSEPGLSPAERKGSVMAFNPSGGWRTEGKGPWDCQGTRPADASIFPTSSLRVK